MIALLLGCDCPSFAEMSVVDTTGRGDVAAAVELIEDFAAWTAVEGVCVPTVELVDDWGSYGGPHQPIWTNVDNASRSLRHSLCSALDHEQGFSAENPALFSDGTCIGCETAADFRAVDFASTCMDGPTDNDLFVQLAQMCDGVHWNEDDVFVQTEVFPGAPHEELRVTDTELHIEERSIRVGDTSLISDYGASGNELLVLTSWRSPPGWAKGIRRIDPDSGVTLGQVPLLFSDTVRYDGKLAVSDGPVYAYLEDYPAHTWTIYAVDLEAGRAEALGTTAMPDDNGHLIASGGELYVLGMNFTPEQGVARRWTPEGETDLPGALIPYSNARAAPDGFEYPVARGGLARFNAATGQFSELSIGPARSGAFFPWSADERLLTASARGLSPPVLLNVVTGEVSLPADPCQNLSWGPWSAALGDRNLVIGTGGAPEDHIGVREILRP